MAEMMSSQYWCHRCDQTVEPILRECLTCPRCNDDFVEELEAPLERQAEREQDQSPFGVIDPRFLALLSGGGLRAHSTGSSDERATRRAAMEQMMNAVAAAMGEMHLRDEGEQEGNGGGSVVVVDQVGVPLFMLQGTHSGVSRVSGFSGTVGDYFIGQGMEALLERLAQMDSNHYGTPPTAKEAVEGLPVVKITEEHLKCELSSECAVCKDEFAVGEETRKLPCEHLYHADCILPWLKMHSSCPVCRYQMPAEEEGSGKQPHSEESTAEGENRNNGNGWLRISMPFGVPLGSIGNFLNSALRRGNNGNNESN